MSRYPVVQSYHLEQIIVSKLAATPDYHVDQPFQTLLVQPRDSCTVPAGRTQSSGPRTKCPNPSRAKLGISRPKRTVAWPAGITLAVMLRQAYDAFCGDWS